MTSYRSLQVLFCMLALGAPAALAGEGLVHRLNDKGICYLAYNGTVLFERENDIFFGHHHASFVKPDGTWYNKGGNKLTRQGNVYTNRTEWGTIVTTIRQEGETLFLDYAVTNASTTDTLVEVELSFSHIGWEVKLAKYGNFNASAFWANDKLGEFCSYEFAGGGMRKIFIDYGKGCFLFGPADPACDDAWPSTLGRERFGYFGGRMEYIKPGETKVRTFAIRFAPAGTSQWDLAKKDAERYEAAHPMRLQWSDRRPLIQDCTLANGIEFTIKNPRRYHTPQDLRTEEGRKKFRAELLKRADDMIRAMRNTDGQGIVMWSIEGIEQKNVMYVGDPTRVRLWPEMEYKDESGVATVDACLRKFTDAGFRIGHCLRPQKIEVRPIEVGTVFRIGKAGTITHARLFSSWLLKGQECAIRIWRNEDQKLVVGPHKHTLDGAEGWVEVDIPDVQVQAGVSYTLAVALPEEGHCMSFWTPEAAAIEIPGQQQPAATGTVKELAIEGTPFDRFTSRVRGYLVPPADGAYTFWVTGDNLAELHLSPDTTDKTKRVAYTDTWTGPDDIRKRPHQKSEPVTLKKGQRYYFELRHAEGIGNDFARVYWAKPGEPADRPSGMVPGTALVSLKGVAGEAEYARWDDVAHNGGSLTRNVGPSATDQLGAYPQGAVAYSAGSPLHDIVFVGDGKRETLFPDEVAGAYAWKNIEHYDVPDPAKHMSEMIAYCKKRWGSTLYYVDSCVFVNNPPVCPHRVNFPLQRHHPPCACSICEPYTDVMSADVWRRVNEAHPDVLVMPENQCTNAHPYTAPFDEGGHHWVRNTPRRVKTQWPGAFTVINISTDKNKIDQNAIDGYVNAVKGGDILMHQQWEHLQDAVKQVYAKAGHVPAVRIVSPSHGARVKAGGDLAIVAEASDRDGKAVKVEFYASTTEGGRMRLGEAAAAPFAFTWKGAPAGRHVLSARATDDAGLSNGSGSVVVNVGEAQP